MAQRIGVAVLTPPRWYTASPVPLRVPSWNVSLQAPLPAWEVGGEGGQCACVCFLFLWHLFTFTTVALPQPWPTLGSGNAILLLFLSSPGGIKSFLLGAFVPLILPRFLQIVSCGVNSFPFQDMQRGHAKQPGVKMIFISGFQSCLNIRNSWRV